MCLYGGLVTSRKVWDVWYGTQTIQALETEGEERCLRKKASAPLAMLWLVPLTPIVRRAERSSPRMTRLPVKFTPSQISISRHWCSPGPNPWRQRRKMLKRGLALMTTVAIACVFALSLFLIGDRESDTFARALLIRSGLLTVVAFASWVNFGIRRAKKRARCQHWRMSTS